MLNKSKNLVNNKKSNTSGFINNFNLDKKIKTLATKTELKLERN